MKVLVTGALGFLGSHLTRALLTEKHEVIALARSLNANYAQFERDPNFRLLRKDICDLIDADLDEVTAVYHLASTVDNYNILTDPYIDDTTNIRGTIRLLETLRKKAGGCNLLFVSSWFVYGHQSQLPVVETARCEPLALYGATKLCAEQIVRAYGRVFDIKYKITRLSNIFGIGDINAGKKKGALLYILKRLKAGEPIEVYYGGDFIRDYLYITDAVEGLIRVMNYGLDGNIYNVGSGLPTKFSQLVTYAREYLGSQSLLKSVDPPAFHKKVQVKDFYMDIAKAKSTGFIPRTPVLEGIKYVCENL